MVHAYVLIIIMKNKINVNYVIILRYVNNVHHKITVQNVIMKVDINK